MCIASLIADTALNEEQDGSPNKHIDEADRISNESDELLEENNALKEKAQPQQENLQEVVE